jgi:hypothetical protein
VEHRELLGNCARRSKFFVTYPAKVGCENETHGQSEVGARFFEGAASGAVLVGRAPSNPVFKRDFCWKDAVVDLGETADEALNVIRDLKNDPERIRQASRKNSIESLRAFDWSYRWKKILETSGIAGHPKLNARIRHLNALAEQTDVDTAYV